MTLEDRAARLSHADIIALLQRQEALQAQNAELQRQLRGYEVAGFAILTRAFLFEGNLDALWQACRWLRRELRSVARALIRRPGAPPLRIILARVSGALAGPWLYLYSCRRMRRG